MFLGKALARHVGRIEPGLGVGAPHPRVHLHAGVHDGAVVEGQGLIDELALVDVPHLAPALTPRAHAAGALEAATFLDSIDLDSGLTEGGRNVEGISCGPARAGFCQAGEKHAQVPGGVGGGDEFLFYGSTV